MAKCARSGLDHLLTYLKKCLFLVQDSGEDWTWWRGLRKNVIAKLCKIHAEAGEVEDKAALPIYPAPHVVDMVRSLLRCTHTHAHTYTHTHTHECKYHGRWAARRVTSCLCCGRSTESSYIVRDSIVVDLYHKCVMVEVPMTKVAAFKMVPFVASPHRHLDWWACVCVCVRVCVCGCVRAYVCTYIHSFMHVKHTQVSHVDSVHQHGGLRGA